MTWISIGPTKPFTPAMANTGSGSYLLGEEQLPLGKHWLGELLAVRGEDPTAQDQVRERCGKLVSDYVATATAEEVTAIKKIANALMIQAAQRPSNRAE